MRFTGSLVTYSALGLVLVSLNNATAANSAVLFPGATHTPSLYKSVVGCGGSPGVDPTWSHYTGVGHLRIGATAASCPASSGITSGSNSYVSAQTTIWAPVTMRAGSGGINVTWNISENSLSTGSVNGSLHCPISKVTTDRNLGYTWYNVTNSTAYCTAIGAFQVYAAAYLYDSTTGAWFYPTNYWSTIYNTSGLYNYSFYSNVSFSNSSYWKYNASLSYLYSWDYGARNYFNATASPTWFINGTFNSSNSYLVYTYAGAYANAYVYGYHHGHASVSVNVAKGADHVDLKPFSIW